jgi:hypothetical protein
MEKRYYRGDETETERVDGSREAGAGPAGARWRWHVGGKGQASTARGLGEAYGA